MKYKDEKFAEICKPIIEHREFIKMKAIKHHNESVFDHVVDVAYRSYKIASKLDLDTKATVRGALLHDFYLYKFNKRIRIRLLFDSFLHAVNHPKIALVNSKKYFKVNDKESNIILSHMFPIRLPRYREAWIVTFVDKFLAVYEYYLNFKKIIIKKNSRIEEAA
ncbi:MAG: HD domain-containing protein [Eubacteriales bacterium]